MTAAAGVPGTEDRRPTVLVVGAGFAGFHALRRLERLLEPQDADLVTVTSNDYFLYTPLLPEVATGVLDPRAVAVPLRRTLRRTRVVPGQVTAVDLATRTATVLLSRSGGAAPGPEDHLTLGFDRLVLAPGSVTRQFDIAGVAEHASGFKTLVEAVYLRDHLLAQLDRADVCPDDADGRAERRERLTVVAVGAGYTGTEFVAQMQRWLTTVADRWDRTGADDVRWILVDVAPAVLPELGARLGAAALTLLRSRGVDVRLGVTVTSASERSVRLTDGTDVACRTLVWGAGVVASPLIAALGCPTDRGRIVVDDQLRVPGVAHVWAAGDAAAAPDRLLPHAAGSPAAVSPPTAQHAQREGRLLARNVAASLGTGEARSYAHRDLGLVADLGGAAAVARPLGIPLSGRAAKVVARGYHLYAVPGIPNKVRVAAGWAVAWALPPQVVQLSVIRTTDALMRQRATHRPVPARPGALGTSGDDRGHEPRPVPCSGDHRRGASRRHRRGRQGHRGRWLARRSTDDHPQARGGAARRDPPVCDAWSPPDT